MRRRSDTERVATRSVADVITTSVLAAIALIGISVIAGWHLRVPALIRVIPGAIAMVYNTALCFVVLAASAWALVTGRGHRALPRAGGLFVAVMGALVTFEYATGISLAIDTLLFYPWDQTLNANPGRMALTTAISFLCSGAALTLLTSRPRAFAPFAIAHMIALSLGLTSAFGYLIGITSLSVFGLGVQMAVHTALALVAYGSTMLAYAWRQSPRTEEKLPRWSAALVILLVPFFFIGFTVTIPGESASAKVVQLSLGFLCAGLLGLAIHKLTESKIAYKGLILISIPLMFVLAFMLLVTQMKRSNERAQAAYLRSREATALSEALLGHLVDAQSGMRGYVITEDPSFAGPYYWAAEEMPEEISRLQALVRDNPEQEAMVHDLSVKASERMASLADTEQMVRAGKRARAIEIIEGGQDKQIMDEFRSSTANFLKEQERLGAARRLAAEQSWQRFDWLLIAGTTLDVLLALMLAFFFSRGISSRLSTLTENARRLAEGKELPSPMCGNDEIADLDRVFHDMATALEQSAKKEQAVFINALDVICSIDGEGKFVKLNPASLKVWGYRPDELIGRRYIDLVAPEDIPKTNEAMASIVAGRAETDFENCLKHKNGSPVNMTWSAFWSEDERLMFCVARDITERKRAQEKIKQINENLERHAVQLEAANKELEAFSYSVSHDLRAPLRHITGFAELLQKSASSNLDEKGRRYLKTISESARQMGRLIDDLLAFSRMGRAEMRCTVVDLGELAGQVRQELEGETEGRSITWQIHSLPRVYGDPSMLRLVLMNLLSNAIKYTQTRREARIEIGSMNGMKNQGVFYVRDNGVGFDMKYADKLFGVFQRLHRADEFEGTGIGLANVRRIAHRHGGRVWAEGSPDAGATFYVSLPMIEKG